MRRTSVALSGVGLLALIVAFIRLAGTVPILAADGKPSSGSVAELTGSTSAATAGHDDPRDSIANPVLLFLAGGPGGTEIGAMRRHGQLPEQNFTVVTFDQRGTGKSADNLVPTAKLTLDRAVSDAVDVTN